MGFFRWLFGIEKRQPQQESIGEPIVSQPRPSQSMILDKPKDMKARKPEYRPLPRTKETGEYIQTILKKANAKDSDAKPFVDNTSNPSEIARLTNKLKAEYSNKK